MQSLLRFVRRQQLRRFRVDRQRTLDRAVIRLGRYKIGDRIPSLALTDAVYGWGNEVWSADEDYLERVMSEAGRANGQILECGSGLSTLLLASVARAAGTHIHSLEHNEAWRQRVLAASASLGLSDYCTIHFAPLKNYGDYDWYTLPDSLPRDVTLVICDGPPSTTPGGRFGALPVLRERLGPVCNFLMDDANRADEVAIISRWLSEPGIVSEHWKTRKGYAKVTVTTPRPGLAH